MTQEGNGFTKYQKEGIMFPVGFSLNDCILNQHHMSHNWKTAMTHSIPFCPLYVFPITIQLSQALWFAVKAHLFIVSTWMHEHRPTDTTWLARSGTQNQRQRQINTGQETAVAWRCVSVGGGVCESLIMVEESLVSRSQHTILASLAVLWRGQRLFDTDVISSWLYMTAPSST